MTRPDVVCGEFLNNFVKGDNGVYNSSVKANLTNVPYSPVDLHRAFYNVVEKENNSSDWNIIKRINPFSGTLDELLFYFRLTGIVFDNLEGKSIDVNSERLKENLNRCKPSNQEIQVSKEIYNQYIELLKKDKNYNTHFNKSD